MDVLLFFGLKWMEFATRDLFLWIVIIIAALGVIAGGVIVTIEILDRRRFATRINRRNHIRTDR